MIEKKNFRLIATLVKTKDDLQERDVYEKTISVKFLRKIVGTVTYNSELGISYRNENHSSILYELEITKPRLFLCKRLVASTELIKTLQFRYDWMQLAVGFNGQPLFILNRPEMEQRWQKMKEFLKKDYLGAVTEIYLDKIESQILTKEKILPCVLEYLYFGLIFPGIPLNHNSDWVGKRNIQISEYERVSFTESITCIDSTDNLKQYRIDGKTLEGETSSISKFEGFISKQTTELLPEKANVKINFSLQDTTFSWNITLQQVLL